jgi:hypothetical protein
MTNVAAPLCFDCPIPSATSFPSFTSYTSSIMVSRDRVAPLATVP